MNDKTSRSVVIAANFTVESMNGSIRGLLAKVCRNFELVFAPYNQVFQQLLDRRSLFYKNKNGVNIVFLRLEDLIDSRGKEVEFAREHLDRIKANASDLVKRLSTADELNAPLFVFLCPASAVIQADVELTSEFLAIEKLIRETASMVSNLYVFGTDNIASRYGVATIDSLKGNVLGHVPYSAAFMSALAVETVRTIDSYRRKPLKVLVLDCDNTLWDGVIGEDGIEGIGLSEKRLFLQNFAVSQSKSGMVVCLNSKNNEADVWEVFEKRNDMVLKKEHVVASRINWLPKSENLRSIAEELQLGLDSLMFIDDDPAVCSEVQCNCPEVSTVLLPSGSDDFRGFFDHLWVFDKLKITEEDRERTRSYQDQVLRREAQAQIGDMTEFLKSLELVCEISELNSRDIPRVSQLTFRTNQFNSTTVRLTEADLRSYISESKKTIWTVKVRDRFGDYGLVGLVIFHELQKSLSVESFMLSCRILGRGVEHRIVKELGEKALKANREFVSFKYVPTAKNAPILHFLAEIGELYKTVEAGQRTYKVPAKAAAECSQQPSREQEQAASIVETQKPVDVFKEVPETDHFQVYIEMAHSLSNNGSLALNQAAKLSRENLQSEFRAAQTDTEGKLTEIWEHLLNASGIGTLDNFFEIGGDSMAAVAVFAEIEERFGVSLPISSLIDSPTIERLAQVIELEPDPSAWKYLVPIQSRGTKPPVFCMHAAGGNVLFYRDLANGLGNDQPVYGLQVRGIADKSETAHDRVEDMAAEYLGEIRQLQRNGPYRLCGSSFGGLVAYECAKQLVDSGETVSCLALFDTYAPEYLKGHSLKPNPFSRLFSSIERVRNVTNQLREIETIQEKMNFVLDRIYRLKHHYKRKILWKKNEFAIQYNKATGRELPNDMSRNHKAIRKAEEDYHPEYYDGKLILIKASDQPKTVASDPYLGWKRYVKREIVTDEVRGTHGAIAIYPSATELAVKLNSYLNENEFPSAREPVVSSEQIFAQVGNA